MEINRNFWSGNTRKITDSDSSTIVEFLDNSLYTDITANPTKYQGVEWDKSVTPWKVNFQSDFFNLDYMLGYGAGYEELITVAKSKLLQERKKGYTFYLSSNGGNNTSNAYARYFPVWLATLSRSDLDLTDNVVNAWVQEKFKELHPVIDFDYSKIFAVPTLQAKNEGSRTLFRESLRASWNPANWSGIGVALLYRDSNNAVHDLALEMVSLNNKFNVPDWTTTDCFNDENAFDNGLCITAYDIQSTSFIYRPLIGERFQRDTGATGTYYYPTSYATDDAAGSVAYYSNREIWVNASDNPIYDANYYGGFIGANSMRPYRRTFATSATFDDVKEYLMQQLAYLGFRFCPDGDAINNPLDSEYFYLPEINDAGVTTGNYYKANSTEAAALPNNDWTTNVYNVTPYDGTDDKEEDDPNEYDEDLTTVINHYKGVTVDSTMEYLMTSHALTEFIGALGSWVTEASEASLKTNFGTTDPQKLIISVIAYPVDLSDGGWAGQEQVGGGINGISFPNTETEYHPQPGWPNYFPIGRIGIPIKRNATSPVIDDWKYMYLNDNEIIEINRRTSSTIYPVKTLNYYNKNKNFLDYGPYSSAVLQVPYCGSIDISPDDFIGENINCKYIIAPSEGTVKVLVERNDLMVDTLTGTIGIPIDLSGTDVSAKLNAIHQANATIQAQRQKMYSSIATFAAGAAITVGTGGSAAPVIMAGLGLASQNQSTKQAIEEANYQIDTAEAPFHQIQAGHGELALTDQAGVRLVIHRPKFLEGYDSEVYGHTVGFATLINSQLKNYHGFTAVNTVDLTGVSCTEEEADMIKTALKSGVYLP